MDIIVRGMISNLEPRIFTVLRIYPNLGQENDLNRREKVELTTSDDLEGESELDEITPNIAVVNADQISQAHRAS